MESLRRAESVIDEKPDSAIRILSEIECLSDDEEEALYALLYTKALVDKGIEQINDSLIYIAADFYSASEDNRRKMQTYLYLAHTKCSDGEYGPALEDALAAYDLAKETDDILTLSRIEYLIARIYVAGFDDHEAYKWDLRALNHTKQCASDKINMLVDSYERISEDLLRMMWIKRAIQYADSAIILSSEPRLHAEEVKCLAYLVMHDKPRVDSIKSILDAAGFQSAHIDNMMKYYADYTKDEYIAYLQSCIQEQNEYISSIKEKSISENRQNYDNAKSDRLTDSLKAKKKEAAVISIFAVLTVLVLTLLIFVIRLRAKNQRIRQESKLQALMLEYENILSEQSAYQDKIKLLEKDIANIAKENNETKESNFELKNEISSAFLKQFSWLDKFASMYMKANKTPREKERVLYERFDKEIEFLASKNNFLKQVQELMTEHNEDLIKQIDDLKLIKSEREIVIYSFCGLSPSLMAILANKSLRAIYNLRVRIKEKLTRIDSQFAHQVLEIL